MASMEEAAQIRDVAARHAYVFDNGLSSPDFFDVEKRMASEEFSLIKERCEKDDFVFEIGCFTGLNLLCLAKLGYERLMGVEFVHGAVEWLRSKAKETDLSINTVSGTFYRGLISSESGKNDDFPAYPWTANRIVCFDVLEHQQNVGEFLKGVSDRLLPGGKALFLVPKGENYNDCGHVAWFPSCECFCNVLDYHFIVEECFELKTCQKLFASCKRRY